VLPAPVLTVCLHEARESNALLGWMIYYFVFWLLPMQDYKLGLSKREGKHLLSWIFLCGFHLLFLDAYCTRLICKALGSRAKFPPHLLLAVAALPLPVLILALPIKVYLDMDLESEAVVMDEVAVDKETTSINMENKMMERSEEIRSSSEEEARRSSEGEVRRSTVEEVRRSTEEEVRVRGVVRWDTVLHDGEVRGTQV